MTDTLVRKYNEKFNNRQIRNLSRNSKKHKLYDRLQIKMLLKLIFFPIDSLESHTKNVSNRYAYLYIRPGNTKCILVFSIQIPNTT